MHKFLAFLLKGKTLIDGSLEQLLLIAHDSVEEWQLQKVYEVLILELKIPFPVLQLKDRLDVVNISDGAEVLIMHLPLDLVDIVLCRCEIFLLRSIDFAGL